MQVSSTITAELDVLSSHSRSKPASTAATIKVGLSLQVMAKFDVSSKYLAAHLLALPARLKTEPSLFLHRLSFLGFVIHIEKRSKRSS